MPHKFNAGRRHKFAKQKYRVTNWRKYNESLRNRGDLTTWISSDAQKNRAAPRRVSRGGQPRYSDMAITMCLTLGMVYKLALRQTQGLMRSISKRMQLEIPVPDFSTLSRRRRDLSLPIRPKVKRANPAHLAVDSTGLKIFCEGEWQQEKHKTKAKRRSWRKLHLDLDLASGDIICAAPTLDNVGDTTTLPELLDQVDAPVSRFPAPSRQIAVQSPAGQWTVHTMVCQLIDGSRRNLARRSKSSFLPQRTPLLARHPHLVFPCATDTLWKFKPMGVWLGNAAAVITVKRGAILGHRSDHIM